jgi:uncharacterized protein YacL
MKAGKSKTGMVHLPAVNPKGATRLVVILLFGAIGAAIFGSIAPVVLDFLYQQIADFMMRRAASATGNPPAPATPGPFVSTGPTTYLPFALLGAMVGGFLGVRFLQALEGLGLRWDKMDAGDKVTVFVGTFAGLVASIPLLQVFQAFDIPAPYRILLITGVTLGLASVSVYALQSMAEILPWNRTRGKGRRSGIKILDTNVIIDGRIYDVAKTGFLEGQLYVPRFVLEELQYIADSHDALRRQRGRRGLEVLKHMQAEFPMEVGTYDKLAPDPNEEVDARLVRLAQALGADIVTNDFNLNRVAALQELSVLSLNDLALSLRTNILPEESLTLKIIREGNQIGQGVGYLDDGTMVVVENGQGHIGETTQVTVTQVIQTERGKMIFAETSVDPERADPPRRRPTIRRSHG